jgi:hypothetical protein
MYSIVESYGAGVGEDSQFIILTSAGVMSIQLLRARFALCSLADEADVTKLLIGQQPLRTDHL